MLVMESKFAGCGKKLGEDQGVSYGRVGLWKGMSAVVRGAYGELVFEWLGRQQLAKSTSM